MIFEEGGKVSIVADKEEPLASEPDLFSNVTNNTRGVAKTTKED
jgi:hypothetical protein